MENTSLNGKLAKINNQILINACFDSISKGILFGIAGIKVVDDNKILDWIYNPVFTNTCGPVLK